MSSSVRWLLVVALLLAVGGPSQATPVAPVSPVSLVDRDRPSVRAVGLIHRWEARRASAYASGDVRGLRGLYTRASRAGLEDAAVLREYADRGLVVEDLTAQLLSVEPLGRRGRLLRVEVVERFVAGTVRAGDSSRALPAGQVTTRVVTLVRTDRGWVVRGIRRP